MKNGSFSNKKNNKQIDEKILIDDYLVVHRYGRVKPEKILSS